MASRIRIAIDCMGGDFGLRSSIPAVVNSLAAFPDLDFVLVGKQQAIRSSLDNQLTQSTRISILDSDDVVLMSDKPSVALRKKPSSSMRMAIDLLHAKSVDAVISAGNTGALMAMGCYVLKTLIGIDRPAICSSIPTVNGSCYLLDLGANVDSSARHLHQFAIMGSILASTVNGIERPRVAVLNIGEEATKGNEQVKLAIKLIKSDTHLNFVGSIEGDQLFSGCADVIVCDGFVGNVALKACEGTALYIAGLLKKQFSQSVLSRLSAWLAGPTLKRVSSQLDPQQYSGASFLGLQGVIIKSHGNSCAKSFEVAIAKARKEVALGTQSAIENRLTTLTVS